MTSARRLILTYRTTHSNTASDVLFPLISAVCALAFEQRSSSILCVIAAVPVLWLSAPSRVFAWLTALAYYLTAARDIPVATAVFFGAESEMLSGLSMYFGSSLALSLPWALCWKKSYPDECLTHLALRSGLLLLLLAVPPLGVIGWGNPIIAAGTVFKGWGVFGLLAFILVIASIARLAQCHLWHALTAFLIFTSIAFSHHDDGTLAFPQGWRGINTNTQLASGTYDVYSSLGRSAILSEHIVASRADYILTPETGAGQWSKAVQQFWQPVMKLLNESRRTAILGAEEYDTEGRSDNTLRFIGYDGGHVYRERFPVPISMWRPFGGEGTAKAHWFDSGMVRLRSGKTALCVVCYEQLLTFPFLSGLVSAKTDLIITASNCWWARQTSLPQSMKQCLYAWARLMNVPVVSAINI